VCPVPLGKLRKAGLLGLDLRRPLLPIYRLPPPPPPPPPRRPRRAARPRPGAAGFPPPRGEGPRAGERAGGAPPVDTKSPAPGRAAVKPPPVPRPATARDPWRRRDRPRPLSGVPAGPFRAV